VRESIFDTTSVLTRLELFCNKKVKTWKTKLCAPKQTVLCNVGKKKMVSLPLSLASSLPVYDGYLQEVPKKGFNSFPLPQGGVQTVVTYNHDIK